MNCKPNDLAIVVMIPRFAETDRPVPDEVSLQLRKAMVGRIVRCVQLDADGEWLIDPVSIKFRVNGRELTALGDSISDSVLRPLPGLDATEEARNALPKADVMAPRRQVEFSR